MRREVLPTIIGVVLFALTVPSNPVLGDAAEAGKSLYLKYCSSCHGPTGKGDGDVAAVMEPRPADLTQMARKAGGQFPFYAVVRMIDGRTTVRGHGDPDMPVWGELFVYWQGIDPDRQALAAGKVGLITEHLLGIQEK